MSDSLPNVTSNVAVTMLYPKSVQSMYWKDEKGSILIPRNMFGKAIITMVLSIEAINIPRVVFESATHLYSTISFH
jgi:hypothetical protein